MSLTYGSVCSGIESASVAWETLGWKPSWFSQFDPEHNYSRQPDFPSRVLAHHWPDVPNLGDMTRIADLVRWGAIEAPDVLVGGTPCQAFSVAGLRKGLSDPRGQLTISFGELADAIDEQREKPCTIIWENVPGVLNSKDNAFGCFLALLAGESCELQPPGRKWTNAGCVSGPKRVVAWRVLDAQYFGVAQRRRRVFVVASADPEFDPTAVLFESESVRRDTPPCRETGSQVAGNAGQGFKTGSHWDGDQYPHPSLSQSFNTGGIGQSNQEVFSQRGAGLVHCFDRQSSGEYGEAPVASTMAARDYKSASDLVVQSYGIAGNTIGRQPDNGGNGTGYSEELSYTLTRSDQHGVAYETHVRRLMPVECERLQGFPDGHTNIPGAKDGPRYKALGNSMAVPVMRWLGRKISPH
ncbi:MAG: site-specific DNA methylase [Siphoviridae sp. ctdc_1]|nr:MAG: site-specific DNA methylase [Siphoviridae sp. ctdc_1]